MRRIPFHMTGALTGTLITGSCLFLGFVREVAIGRRSETFWLSRETAIKVEHADLMAMSELGYRAAKVLHHVLVHALGFGPTEALGAPLAIACFIFIIASGAVGFALGLPFRIGQPRSLAP